jgi:hypothetical protein
LLNLIEVISKESKIVHGLSCLLARGPAYWVTALGALFDGDPGLSVRGTRVLRARSY